MKEENVEQVLMLAPADGPAWLLRMIRVVVRSLLMSAAILSLMTAPSAATESIEVTDAALDASGLLDQARQARASGNSVKAIALLEEILLAKPDNVDALVELGFAQLASSDLVAAKSAFSETLRLAPDYVDATLGLAYIAFRRSELEHAERLAAAVLKAAPDYEAARVLLDAAKTAKTISDDRTRPVPRPISFLEPNDFGLLSEGLAPETRAAPRPKKRRAFLSLGGNLNGPRDIELTHVLEIRKPGGVTLVLGLRHTSRTYGDATQLQFSALRKEGDVLYGIDLALGRGADNLARALVGVSVDAPLAETIRVSGRLRYETFENAHVLTFASRATAYLDSGGTFSLGLTTSGASNVSGTATVVDARAALPVSGDLTLRLGAAYGRELDGLRKRDLRSFAVGLTREINDDLAVTVSLSSEPGRKRVDLTLARRF